MPGRGTPPTLYTVGHSTHEADAFRRLLVGAGVEAVADVRRYPGSRRNPQFNVDELAASLRAAGIDYLPFGDQLGGRRRPVPGSPNDGWRVAQFQGYADHMASAEFTAGLDALLARARERQVAVMCAEADWHRCHRRLLADAALVRGFDVRHLLRDGALDDHRLTDFAVARGTELTYPPQQPTLGV